MTFIANPIYDVVFKFMMEDNRVAKMLLSALLKKEILELEMRRHEYTAIQKDRISLYRIDFAAKIQDADGSEHLVTIELQKTWLGTESLRFRQYLGVQYQNKDNMCSDGDAAYGLPIISIYILGHKLGDISEPVIYVRRRYLDYDDHVIEQTDQFIESLTHDSIVVQIPYLKGRTRTRLERLLNVFDQDYCIKTNDHFLEINEDIFLGDEQLILHRLLQAGTTPDVRRAMEIEDEILSEIESRDTTILLKDQALKQKDQAIKQKEQEIEQSKQEIEQSKQVIEQQKAVIKRMVHLLTTSGLQPADIAQQLSIPITEVLNHLSATE